LRRPTARLTVCLAAAFWAVPSLPAAAQVAPPGGGFSLPVQCRPGADCWILNYADTDPGPAARDFSCGPRANDGHKGTDLAVRDLASMRAGVPVIAIADGTVLRRRDGMADTGLAGLRGGRDCGNGVVIDHGGGWTSQYCHMRRGSVAVTPGQRVGRGAPLGLVGMSGQTEFPHLHLTLRLNGTVVDPFTGRAFESGCGRAGAALWRRDATMAYDAGGLYAAGFATGRVRAERILQDAGSPATLPRGAPALVLWGAAFGVRTEDVLHLAVTAPDGRAIVDHRARLDRNRAWHIAFAGVRPPAGGWAAGTYRGVVRHLRQGKRLSARRIAVSLR